MLATGPRERALLVAAAGIMAGCAGDSEPEVQSTPVRTAPAAHPYDAPTPDCAVGGRFTLSHGEMARHPAFGAMPPEHPVLRQLDSLARDTIADTLLVVGGYARASQFGSRLDSSLALLRDSIGIDSQVLQVGNRLRLGNGWTAYLLMGPEMYGGPGTVELWMYHPDSARFARPICLANGWGDAGDHAEWVSWLVDVDRDGLLDIVHGVYSSSTDLDLETDESSEPAEEHFQVEVLRSVNGWFVLESDPRVFADARHLFTQRLIAVTRDADHNPSDTIPSLPKEPTADSASGLVRPLDKPPG